jgi:hypothetical protein
LTPDAPELQLAAMLDDYRQSSAGGSRARFLFANLQQRLFSSIAAFHRTLTTHRKSLVKKSEGIREFGLLFDDRDLARRFVGDYSAHCPGFLNLRMERKLPATGSLEQPVLLRGFRRL